MSVPVFGLAPKLIGLIVLSTGLVALMTTWRASTAMHGWMDEEFTGSGTALALSLASVVEHDPDGMNTEALKVTRNIPGVTYVYFENAKGELALHSFSSAFPPGLRGQNRIGPGGLSGPERVKVQELQLDLGVGSEQKVIDLAAPIASGALGTMHVGVDHDHVHGAVAAMQRELLLIGGATAAVSVALGLFLVLAMVIRPVRELTRATTDIVSRGDLTQKIPVRSRDEIGQLAAAFSGMVEKLRQIPTSLQDSTAILAAAVAELTTSTGEQSQTLTRQAVALQETQVTAQEIQQTSLVASQKAEAVLLVAERADSVSRSGEIAIEQSLGGIADLRQRVEEISEKIAQLSERTLQIGGITQTVKDLADQSNMLALNASIEAVRSGEHGKGFAVVAREIRSLADQSIKATERVREILDDIAGAIRSAVESSETGTSRMETGLVQVRTSGENLRELSSIVRDNSAAVRQIAAAVSQQNAGITQIFGAVQELGKMMEESMARLDSTTKAAGNLREVAARVQQIVQTFRV